MAEAEKKAKVKTPTAHKRWKQDIKRKLRNTSAKARLRTARVAFEKMPAGEGRKDLVASLHGLIDRAAKSGIFHPNKAARLKSRAAKKANLAAKA